MPWSTKIFPYSGIYKGKVPTGKVSPQASVLVLQMAASSLCAHIGFPLCTGILNVSSSFYKDTRPIDFGSHPSDLTLPFISSKVLSLSSLVGG